MRSCRTAYVVLPQLMMTHFVGAYMRRLTGHSSDWRYFDRIRNSMKFCNNLDKIVDRSQQIFAHVTTVTVSWRVQNSIVISWAHFKQEHCKFLSIFEFDRNTINGTGTRNVWMCWGEAIDDSNSSCITPKSNKCFGGYTRHVIKKYQFSSTQFKWHFL